MCLWLLPAETKLSTDRTSVEGMCKKLQSIALMSAAPMEMRSTVNWYIDGLTYV